LILHKLIKYLKISLDKAITQYIIFFMPKKKAVNRVKKARLKLGLTQKQLSEQIDLSREFISRVENGHVPYIGLEPAKRISKALRTSIEELFP
jgi:DNA-binding XRE family transcriptional regulator